MNLALRKATKAEIIDAGQHDAIIAQLPKPSGKNGLDPESNYYLESWMQFGWPVAAGMMGAMDLRAMQIPGREAWLEREVIAYGEDPDVYRLIWRELDQWAVQSAQDAMKGDDG